ncbi:MAG: hypothetical protein IPI28_04565 [Candidatus Omnitrophica bacterium]|nr:hypothetical protein [Candidatus Omnitrophota bacterium]
MLREARTGSGRTPYQIEGMKGSIGIISSMTEEFFESCSRLRLSATGGVKTCLFGPEG